MGGGVIASYVQLCNMWYYGIEIGISIFLDGLIKITQELALLADGDFPIIDQPA